MKSRLLQNIEDAVDARMYILARVAAYLKDELTLTALEHEIECVAEHMLELGESSDAADALIKHYTGSDV